MYVNLYKNGVYYTSGTMNSSEAANTVLKESTVSTGIFLSKNDTLYFTVFQNSGGAIALNTTSGANFFSIHKTSVGTGN
jgi:hypothetical protein